MFRPECRAVAADTPHPIRVNVLHGESERVDARARIGECRGSGVVYVVAWTAVAGWTCSCPALGRCAHVHGPTMRDSLQTEVWPREESNLRARIRSPSLYPLSYGARLTREGGGWDSNPRPPGPQPGALPTELPPPWTAQDSGVSSGVPSRSKAAVARSSRPWSSRTAPGAGPRRTPDERVVGSAGVRSRYRASGVSRHSPGALP
jgi:hypothetical protein